MTTSTDIPTTALKLPKAMTAALVKAGYDTAAKLAAVTRHTVSGTPGIHASNLDAIASALSEHGLAFAAINECKSCPTCPTCGQPRAVDPRSVVTSRGRAKHVGFASGPVCDGCDTHHRQLVAAANTQTGV